MVPVISGWTNTPNLAPTVKLQSLCLQMRPTSGPIHTLSRGSCNSSGAMWLEPLLHHEKVTLRAKFLEVTASSCYCFHRRLC